MNASKLLGALALAASTLGISATARADCGSAAECVCQGPGSYAVQILEAATADGTTRVAVEAVAADAAWPTVGADIDVGGFAGLVVGSRWFVAGGESDSQTGVISTEIPEGDLYPCVDLTISAQRVLDLSAQMDCIQQVEQEAGLDSVPCDDTATSCAYGAHAASAGRWWWLAIVVVLGRRRRAR